MEERYQRNRFYITPEEQLKVKQTKVLFVGVGLGSVIAECALRLGFETITLIDSGVVDTSDLCWQNYDERDVGRLKVESLKSRLEKINTSARIKVINSELELKDLYEIISEHSIVVDSLEPSSHLSEVFNQCSKKMDIPIIRPYNLGWAGLATIAKLSSDRLKDLRGNENWGKDRVGFSKYIADYFRYWGAPQIWLEDMINQFEKGSENLNLPQLSVASWIIGGLVANLLFDIATEKDYKKIPQFYFLTAKR